MTEALNDPLLQECRTERDDCRQRLQVATACYDGPPQEPPRESRFQGCYDATSVPWMPLGPARGGRRSRGPGTSPRAPVPNVSACHALAAQRGYVRYGVQRADGDGSAGGPRYHCLGTFIPMDELRQVGARHGCATEGGLTVGHSGAVAVYTVAPLVRNPRFQLPGLPPACLTATEPDDDGSSGSAPPEAWSPVGGAGPGGVRLCRNRSPAHPGLASPVGMQFVVLEAGRGLTQGLPMVLPGATFRVTVRAARGSARLPTLVVSWSDGQVRAVDREVMRVTLFTPQFESFSSVTTVPAGLLRGGVSLVVSNDTTPHGPVPAPLALAEVALEPVV